VIDLHAQEKSSYYISFEDRLQEFVNSRTRDFYWDMRVKEKFLTLYLRNLIDEIKARQGEGGLIDLSEFDRLFGRPDTLVQSYAEELQQLVGIFEELERLEKAPGAREDPKTLERVLDLKERVKAVIEDRDFYKRRYLTPSVALELIREYSGEIESLLRIYDELSYLRRKINDYADKEAAKEIARQIDETQRRIDQALTGKAEDQPLVDRYYRETLRIVGVLRELDNLKERIDPHKQEKLYEEVIQLKDSILRKVDKALLSTLGYTNFERVNRNPRFEEFFEEWKASQVLKYNVKLSRARILKQQLLKSATDVQRERMFKADLAEALVSYASKDFALAEMQFKDILDTYTFYQDVGDLVFYLAESYLAQRKYESAKNYYLRVVKDFSSSEYAPEAYYRLMLISETFGDYQAFQEYYGALEERFAQNPKEELFVRASYLAGYVHFSQGNYDQAISCLERVPPDSKYYYPALFLIATSYAGKRIFSKAIPIFTFLSEEKNYPWTDAERNLIKNNALLKLGFIYYEQGEFAQALRCFERISKGFDKYDEALLGKAWAEFQMGQLTASINDLDRLFWNFLTSNYLYEAKVLSAHCNKILGNVEEALQDLRYVANARRALRISESYNQERQKILAQLREIERLETQALLMGDRARFEKLFKLRDKLNAALREFYYQGYPGFVLLEEFEEERARILKQIQDLEAYEEVVKMLGYKDLQRDIRRRIRRLMGTLEVYQADRRIKKVDYFADYPLARKESVANYREEILNRILQQIRIEKSRIAEGLQNVQNWIKQAKKQDNWEAVVKLETKEQELIRLRDRLDSYYVYLLEREDKEVNTDFNRWADFSGFGMSDLDFTQLKLLDRKIEEYQRNAGVIELAIARKKKEMEKRVWELTQRMNRLQREIERKKLLEQLKKKEEYFQTQYFVTEEPGMGVEKAKGELEFLLKAKPKEKKPEEKPQP